jgi:hypothetical protein
LGQLQFNHKKLLPIRYLIENITEKSSLNPSATILAISALDNGGCHWHHKEE